MYCKIHGLNQPGPLLELTPIDDPKNNNLMSGIVVDCCNGLLCIYKSKPSRGFFLWNPATRISIELPEFTEHLPIQKWGFGWDEESGAYKVFVGMSDQNNEGIGRVYSSLTNSWKKAKQIGDLSSLRSGYGKVACGKIHWLLKSGHIETFDLKSEVFGTMEQPCKPEGDGSDLYLRESRGFLKVVCKNIKDAKKSVWVMKEYGVKESWVERISKSKPRKKNNRCCKRVVYVESLVSLVL